jgi:CheY-like chemotaxis protein
MLANLSILVIDNEPAILEGMAELLGGWGCRVRIASDEAAARTALAAPPQVIIADYHLDQGAHGDAVVGRLRSEIGRDIPAIIITADREPALRERLGAEGFHLLTKPVKPAQLRALLSRLTG